MLDASWEKNLSINEFKGLVMNVQSHEKYYAIKNNTLDKHLRKWYPDDLSNKKDKRGDNDKANTNMSRFIQIYIDQMT